MHVLFIHPNFPAQFGHLATFLSTRLNWQCTVLTSVDTTHLQLPFTHLNYKVDPGPQPKAFYNPNSLEGLMKHLTPIYAGMKGLPQIQPDLVVGHMSYGSLLFLRNLYSCPFVGYFELLPPPFWTDKLNLRREFPPPEQVRLFNATYHALTYLHLHMIDAGYTPTNYQLSTCPPEMRHKLRVIHDGIDTDFYIREPIQKPTEFRGVQIPAGTRVVTYVSRGLESARGFDIFMKVAKRICQERSDTIFFIAGDERTNYGHDLHHIGMPTFKEYVLSQDTYDLSRFHFLGLIPTTDLRTLYCLSDLHFYLTVPFVLSWSLLQAMSTGCTILGSATPPVLEAIDDEKQGLLADFYDVDALTSKALRVLADPEAHRYLGEAARARVMERYAIGPCLEQLVNFFVEVQQKKGRDHYMANLPTEPAINVQ